MRQLGLDRAGVLCPPGAGLVEAAQQQLAPVRVADEAGRLLGLQGRLAESGE